MVRCLSLFCTHLLPSLPSVSLAPQLLPPDYQSRRLDVRLRSNPTPGQEPKKEFVHMLNSTLSATERTLCCLLENHQTPDGVRVPEILRPYMMGIDFIPFKKTCVNGKYVDLPKAAPAASGASMATSSS